jgi:hypothetical protein
MSSVNGVFNPNAKKKIMIGMIGQTYSNQFMISWTMLLNYLLKKTNYDVNVVQAVSKNRIISRFQSIGLDMNKDVEGQKAFQDTDYDVYIMIDSDMLFKPEDVSTLIDLCMTKHDVVSGLYVFNNEKYFVSHENGTELVNIKDIDKDDKECVEVPFTGLGFFACKKKVIDSLESPYFKNFLSEELTFCNSIKEKGFKVMLCKEVRVSREMNVIF